MPSQTEQDFAQVAGAGLNHIRIPIGYWAIETRANEPFLAQVSWTYVIYHLLQPFGQVVNNGAGIS